MVTVYAWDKQIERKVGEKVRAAAKELRKWAKGPQKSIEVASWGKPLAIMITVFLPEQADEMLGCDLTPDGSKVLGTEVTLREAYPEMCPVPGQAWVYISDMSLDYPDEVMSKAAEVFKKYGAQKIWADILRNGCRLQRRHEYG